MHLFCWRNSYTGKTTQTGVRVSPGRGWYEISRKEYNAQQSVERTVSLRAEKASRRVRKNKKVAPA